MAERTIIVRRSSLGDVVLVGAVTAALPVPATVVTSPRYVEVARALRGVGDVVPWPAGWDLTAMLDQIPPGRLVDLQGDRRVARLARLGGRAVIRWPKGRARRVAWLARLASGRGSVAARYGRACGVVPVSPPWIDGASHRSGLAIVPGAAWATKRWREDGFIDVGRRFGGEVFVLGSEREKAIVVRVAAEIPGAHAVAERGFAQTLDVLRRARVAVGGDTGLLHLAAACGVPTVTLMGPTHVADGFVDRPGRVIARELWCRPCALHGRRRCPLVHHRCMRDLDIEEVVAAVTDAASGAT